MNDFSKNSMNNLSFCHNDLIKTHLEFIKRSRVDYGITYGHRKPEEQFELFKQGRAFINNSWQIVDKSKVVTYCDGYTKKSEHNNYPSTATDFIIYVPGHPELNYDPIHLAYIGSGLVLTGQMLYESGEIEHLIKWGGNWDMDGILLRDQSLQDLCHIQLYKP